MFNKVIKRDFTQFPILNDESKFKSWHRSFITTADAQDVRDVLNPHYVPTKSEDIDLFKAKQRFIYAVADRILKTNRGIVYLGQHEDTMDAQQVFSKTIKHYTTSRIADISASDILAYLTTMKLGSGKWNGTAVSFISHWQ